MRGALPLRLELLFLGFDLIEALAMGGDGFPSTPTVHDSGDFSDQGRLWSSSGAYFLIGTGDGGMAVGPRLSPQIFAAGQGSLAERGAAWLFVEYLRGQTGTDSVLGLLTGTTATGTVNVEAVMGRAWADLFSDWSTALELERQVSVRGALPLRLELLFLGFDLIEALAMGGDGFPSTPTVHDSGDFSDQGRLDVDRERTGCRNGPKHGAFRSCS